MEILVSGHQVDISDAFRVHAQTQLQGISDKYFSRAIGATATLRPGPHDNAFICDVVMHVGHDIILKASGRGGLAQQALDIAADKIETQLRRYKRRLKNRNAAEKAALQDALTFNAGYTVFQADGAEAEQEADNPIIIAETKVDIPEASVSDAVMMLDLRNTTALLFKNSMTGLLNMVYRRDDGNIGWVEPASQ
jgi:ribosomal subunit interface protein